MTILQNALIDSRRRNIERYARLLATRLAAHERAYVHKRLTQERAELDSLVTRAFRATRKTMDRPLGAAVVGTPVT
jgi:hypothetical protein